MNLRVFFLLLAFSFPALAGPLEEAETLIEQQEFDQARRALEEVVENSAYRAQSLVLLTRVCNELEDYEDGIEYGEQALELLPESSEAHFQYAVAVRIKMSKVNKLKAMWSLGDYKDALQKAIELDPSNAEAREEEIGYLYNAPGIAGGDKKKAKEKLRELESIDRPRALRFKASIYFGEGDFEAGRKILQSLLEEKPEDVSSRLILAFQYQQRKEYQAAIKHFALIRDAEDRREALGAQYQLARSRILGKIEVEKAVAILLAYIEQGPDRFPGIPSRSNAYWRLGNAHELMGEKGKAREAYEQAVALDDENKEARKALKQLPPG